MTQIDDFVKKITEESIKESGILKTPIDADGFTARANIEAYTEGVIYKTLTTLSGEYKQTRNQKTGELISALYMIIVALIAALLILALIGGI